MRVLFICKKNEIYGFKSYARRSSGLFNSTQFIVRALRKHGVAAEIVEVDDNNSIDREVSLFRPDVVIIEAFWVVPEKFDVLKKLHPRVKWFVHLHSGIPFLALEGVAIEWARGCVKRGVKLIMNSRESYEAFRSFLCDDDLIFLPNIYIGDMRRPRVHTEKEHIDISSFGAIRPLKNQLLQAMAALRFAREIGRPLRFHVNYSRVETMGQPCLKNLKALFQHQPDAHLVHLEWLDPSDFLNYLEHHIDLNLQVSLSETFNVVTADAVTAGVPIVVSKEIPWASHLCRAEDDEIDSIVETMHRVWRWRALARWNQYLLKKNSSRSQKMWLEFVRSLQ